MSLEPQSKLGQYEIVEKIGEGGMGQVYRARDAKLGREVAIKVLPPDLAAETERVARFRREAMLLASLSHPNVASIHGFDDDGDRHFLVMELVEGQSLDGRLRQGRLELDETLELARQVAEGLESAHAGGIVHRDLKPANVMVRPDGQVKVLDFGLAKALVDDPQSTGGLSQSPTLLTAETQHGVLLGTAAYMSPEQARGKSVDARTDIWAFGCLLYEMLSGQRAFAGETVSDTLANVLKGSIDESALPAETPGRILRLLRRCLVRDSRQRLQSIGDARIVLQEVLAEPDELSGEGGAAAPSVLARLLPWLGIAAALVAGVWLGRGLLSSHGPGEQSVQAALVAPPARLLPTRLKAITGFSGVEMGPSWSPDGNLVAYAHGENGPMDIFVAPRAGGSPIALVESAADDMNPRWSPKGTWIAFVSNRDNRTGVYLVPPLGGPVRLLAESGHAPLSLMALESTLGERPWSPDESELILSRAGPGGASQIVRIQVADGREEELTKPSPLIADMAPSYSWDGRRVAFVRSDVRSGAELRVLELEGGSERALVQIRGVISSVTWAPDDSRLFFGVLQGDLPGVWTVMADGSGVEPVTIGPAFGAEIAISAGGRFATASYSHQTDLYLQPLDGSEPRRLTAHSADNFAAQVSPDGRTVAYMSSRTGNPEVWLLDLESGEERNLTASPTPDALATWAPDGQELVFLSLRDDGGALFSIDAAGRRPRQLGLVRASFGWGWSAPRWSPDGLVLGYVEGGVSGTEFRSLDPETGESQALLAGVQEFVWYRDSKRIIYITGGIGDGRPTEMRARDLESGEEVLLFAEPHVEIQLAPDGSAVSFCRSSSHYDMNLQLLRLLEPDEPGGLPRAAGEPEIIAHGRGEWHVHNGGFTPDGKAVIYTRDTDIADIYEIEGLLSTPDE